MESDTRVNSYQLKFGAFIHTYLSLQMFPLSDVMKVLQEKIPKVLGKKIRAKDVLRRVVDYIDPQLLVELQRRKQEYEELVEFFEKEQIAANEPQCNEEDTKVMMRWWNGERYAIIEHIVILVKKLDLLMDFNTQKI